MEMQPLCQQVLKIGRKNSLEVPADLDPRERNTNGLNLGLGTVGAQLGVKLDGKSSVDLDYKFKVDKQTKVSKSSPLETKRFNNKHIKSTARRWEDPSIRLHAW